jgi:hypothetical protein
MGIFIGIIVIIAGAASIGAIVCCIGVLYYVIKGDVL